MIARTFVDSNILIYAHDLDAGYRHQRAADCLARLWDTGAGLLSTQVLQEFYVNVTQKIKSPIPRTVAREVVRDYAPWVQSWITPETISRASGIGEIWQAALSDSMIVAGAAQRETIKSLRVDRAHRASV